MCNCNVCFLFLGYYNQSQGQSQSQNTETSNDMHVLITGTTGISWRKKPSTVSTTVCEFNHLQDEMAALNYCKV